MASLIRSPRTPHCLNCLRRTISIDISESAFPFHRQLRGKKKSAKQPATVAVRLLEDIRGYGRKGSIIPVVPGRMRNIWYPQQMAEYMTQPKLREFNKRDLVIERDYTFGIEQPERSDDIEGFGAPGVVDVDIKLLSPIRATEIISTTLPSHLDFYRTPIANSEPETPKEQSPVRPSRRNQATSAAAADLAAFEESMPKTPTEPQMVAIYGSVSTADIVESVKAVLAETEEGARVVLSAEDITIVTDEGPAPGAEADRLKALGEFEVDIRVKGGELVRRFISVKAQEAR